MLTMSLHCKETNSPTPWNSKLPKKYKCNVIIRDLNHEEKILISLKKSLLSKSNLKKQIFQLRL